VSVSVAERMQWLLTRSSTVTDLVPAQRIKVRGAWQKLEAPYIIHFPVTAEATQCHGGPLALRIWPEYQVSVFATTYGEAQAIATALIAVLDGYCDADTDRVALVRPPLPVGDFDTERGLEHLAIGFTVAGALT
jgi:hypothetical protein